MTIYKQNGYDGRNSYLSHISDEYGVHIEDVHYIATLLGEGEDFDGLLAVLEDFDEEE